MLTSPEKSEPCAPIFTTNDSRCSIIAPRIKVKSAGSHTSTRQTSIRAPENRPIFNYIKLGFIGVFHSNLYALHEIITTWKVVVISWCSAGSGPLLRSTEQRNHRFLCEPFDEFLSLPAREKFISVLLPM